MAGRQIVDGSRDLRRIYVIDPKKWEVLQEKEPPGIPWAAVATNGTLRFTIGEGSNDDRYIRRFVPETGFSEGDKIACPEFTGSYLSYDGENIYLSQWYKHRILKLDAKGNIVRAIDIGATYAWMRFGSLSCLLLAIASVGALFVALVAAAFSFKLAGMKRFDPTNIVYGFSYFVLQPSVAVAAVIGQTLFVMWVVRNRGKNSKGI